MPEPKVLDLTNKSYTFHAQIVYCGLKSIAINPKYDYYMFEKPVKYALDNDAYFIEPLTLNIISCLNSNLELPRIILKKKQFKKVTLTLEELNSSDSPDVESIHYIRYKGSSWKVIDEDFYR